MIKESVEYLSNINKLLLPKKLKAFDYYILVKGVELYHKKEDDFYINELTQEAMHASNETSSKIRISIHKLVSQGYMGKYRDNEDERKVYLTFYGKYYEKYLSLENYLKSYL